MSIQRIEDDVAMRAEVLRKNDRIHWFVCAGTLGRPPRLVRNVFAAIDLDVALPTYAGWPPDRHLL